MRIAVIALAFVGLGLLACKEAEPVATENGAAPVDAKVAGDLPRVVYYTISDA